MVGFKKTVKIFFKQKNLVLLGLILLLGAFLRLYKIDGYMTFLGDEGRDGLVWLRMVRWGKFTLIGPQTSIGNMYLGPLYYYLMLPFYVLFGLSPVGPSVGVALFGIATIFLIWWMGREWFGEVASLIAAFLYAISPVVITYSRSSWNPNIMPFFALLTIWGIWGFWGKENYLWLPVIGITLSFCLQSHYLGLLLLPLVGIFWGIRVIGEIRESKTQKEFILYTLYFILLLLLLTVMPLVWFDLRHDFINTKAFYKFFSVRQTTVNLKVYKAIPNLWPLWEMMIIRLSAAKEIFWGRILSFVLFLGLVFSFWRSFWRSDLPAGRTSPDSPGKKALVLLLVWLLIGLMGMGLYKQHIYDHYFGFIFPAPFLLVGFLLGELGKSRRLGRLGFLGVLGIVTWLNLMNSPLNYQPNYQMAKVQEIDKKIIEEAGGQPFNFALIAKQNYEAGYEYFLEAWRATLVHIDPQKVDETIADQLFVVCEDKECQPINHPKAQIANFGWAKIDDEWEFPWGVKLFKLVHLEKSDEQKVKS